jgi:hypothetical protein
VTGIAMEYAVRPVWIDPSWFSWQLASHEEMPYGRSLPNDIARQYEIHEHACNRLVDDPSDFDRIDAIMTLRRTVGQRVRMLMDTYQLRKLQIGPKPKHDLELLSYLGIIRPFMLKRLIDIRNFVEHQDSSPPPTDECLMFADLVWYFLRSTDGLVELQLEQISFLSPDFKDIWSLDRHAHQIDLNFPDPFSEPPAIKAWLDLSSLTYEPRADWMKIESTKLIESKEYEPTQVTFTGRVNGTDAQMKSIYEIYFRFSHFR